MRARDVEYFFKCIRPMNNGTFQDRPDYDPMISSIRASIVRLYGSRVIFIAYFIRAYQMNPTGMYVQQKQVQVLIY